MRFPPIGWAFFGLAVLVLIGYVLNRGLFIGSEIDPIMLTLNNGSTLPQYTKRCRYLHFTGTSHHTLGLWDSSERANDDLCRMFDE